ncbi:hypothetical protein KKA09_01415 [Patescibacteria group bacterium]|nr:hypothetical protein [Patescibacteria group bacterium]
MSKFLIIKFTNKKYLIFGALFFVFCFLPLNSIFAFWGEVGDLLMLLPTKLISVIFWLFLSLARGFLWVSTMILTWAIGNPWAVSFTDPAGNDIIKIGWVLLRDFTNMFFILGLAYIGLATSLGLSNFDTKNTFIKILLIALVINFTPIICGVIVDICNIISRFFLIGIDFSATEKAYNEQMGVIWNGLDNIVSDWKVAVQAIMLFVYGIFTALVLLIFALIFLVRAPIIWIYVILSPIAFFFWVFPNFQKWHSKWWNGFLEWCFIAIPGAFFLYLSQQVMVAATGGKLIDASGLDSGFFASLAPYFATLIFLVIGLCITIKINGMATGAVMAAAGVATGGIATGLVAGYTAIRTNRNIGSHGFNRETPPPDDGTPLPPPDDDTARSVHGSNIGGGFGEQQYAGTATGGIYARREGKKISQHAGTLTPSTTSMSTGEGKYFKKGIEEMPRQDMPKQDMLKDEAEFDNASQIADTSMGERSKDTPEYAGTDTGTHKNTDERSKDTAEFGGFTGGDTSKHGGFTGGKMSEPIFGIHKKKSEGEPEEKKVEKIKEAVRKGAGITRRVLKDLFWSYQTETDVVDKKTGKIIGEKPKTYYGGLAGWFASKTLGPAYRHILKPIYKGAMKKPTTFGGAKDVFWKTTKKTVTGKEEKSKAEKLTELMGWDKDTAKAFVKAEKEAKEKKEKEEEKKEKEEEANKEKENKT